MKSDSVTSMDNGSSKSSYSGFPVAPPYPDHLLTFIPLVLKKTTALFLLRSRAKALRPQFYCVYFLIHDHIVCSQIKIYNHGERGK